MKNLLYIFILALLFTSCSSDKKVNIWMIGDSTMALKKPDRDPEAGWGEGFGELLNDKAILKNHAANGRSTKSFLSEQKWKAVYDSIRPGDFVIIQFGHNDEKTLPKLSTDAFTSFKQNLKVFVEDTRSKGGHPIICSSIVRRHFNDDGKLIDTHGDFILAAREAAMETNTPYVDMEALTHKLINELGPEKSKSLFLFCKPGEYPNRPAGVEDSTHLNHFGSREVSALFEKNAREQNLPIIRYFISK